MQSERMSCNREGLLTEGVEGIGVDDERRGGVWEEIEDELSCLWIAR